MASKVFFKTFDGIYVDINMLEVVALVSFSETHHVCAYTWSGRQVFLAKDFKDMKRAEQVRDWCARVIALEGLTDTFEGRRHFIPERKNNIITLPTKWTDRGEPDRA